MPTNRLMRHAASRFAGDALGLYSACILHIGAATDERLVANRAEPCGHGHACKVRSLKRDLFGRAHLLEHFLHKAAHILPRRRLLIKVATLTQAPHAYSGFDATTRHLSPAAWRWMGVDVDANIESSNLRLAKQTRREHFFRRGRLHTICAVVAFVVSSQRRSMPGASSNSRRHGQEAMAEPRP